MLCVQRGANLLIVAVKSGNDACVSLVLQALKDMDTFGVSQQYGCKQFAAINFADQVFSTSVCLIAQQQCSGRLSAAE